MPKGFKKDSASKQPTSGYPEIESLIDTEDFTEVNKDFQKSYDELEAISKKKKGLKKSREAKFAMKSIDLTMELFRELLTIKYKLQDMIASQEKTNPKKG